MVRRISLVPSSIKDPGIRQQLEEVRSLVESGVVKEEVYEQLLLQHQVKLRESVRIQLEEVRKLVETGMVKPEVYDQLLAAQSPQKQQKKQKPKRAAPAPPEEEIILRPLISPPVRWGIIGLGAVCEVKAGPAFQHASNSTLTAVMRRTPGKATEFAERHALTPEAITAYTSAEELIAAVDVDAVYIATPPSTHVELALLAAAAGKPCLVEKPIARTAHGSARMVDAFGAARVPLFAAYYRRAQPRFLHAKSILERGRLGAIVSVSYTHHEQRDAGTALANNQTTADLPWRYQPRISGGGLFFDVGCHALDLIDFMLGTVVEFHSFARNRATPSIRPAEDEVSIDGKIHLHPALVVWNSELEETPADVKELDGIAEEAERRMREMEQQKKEEEAAKIKEAQKLKEELAVQEAAAAFAKAEEERLVGWWNKDKVNLIIGDTVSHATRGEATVFDINIDGDERIYVRFTKDRREERYTRENFLRTCTMVTGWWSREVSFEGIAGIFVSDVVKHPTRGGGFVVEINPRNDGRVWVRYTRTEKVHKYYQHSWEKWPLKIGKVWQEDMHKATPLGWWTQEGIVTGDVAMHPSRGYGTVVEISPRGDNRIHVRYATGRIHKYYETSWLKLRVSGKQKRLVDAMEATTKERIIPTGWWSDRNIKIGDAVKHVNGRKSRDWGSVTDISPRNNERVYVMFKQGDVHRYTARSWNAKIVQRSGEGQRSAFESGSDSESGSGSGSESDSEGNDAQTLRHGWWDRVGVGVGDTVLHTKVGEGKVVKISRSDKRVYVVHERKGLGALLKKVRERDWVFYSVTHSILRSAAEAEAAEEEKRLAHEKMVAQIAHDLEQSKRIPFRARWDFASPGTYDNLIITGTRATMRVGIMNNVPIRILDNDAGVDDAAMEETEITLAHEDAHHVRCVGKCVIDTVALDHAHQPLIQSIVNDLLSGGAGGMQCCSTGESALRTALVLDAATEKHYAKQLKAQYPNCSNPTREDFFNDRFAEHLKVLAAQTAAAEAEALATIDRLNVEEERLHIEEERRLAQEAYALEFRADGTLRTGATESSEEEIEDEEVARAQRQANREASELGKNATVKNLASSAIRGFFGLR